MSDKMKTQFTRFSVFYSPLITPIAGGFLEKEGLQPEHSLAWRGTTALKALGNGSAQVVRSAPSYAILALDQGKTPGALLRADQRNGRLPSPQRKRDCRAAGRLA